MPRPKVTTSNAAVTFALLTYGCVPCDAFSRPASVLPPLPPCAGTAFSADGRVQFIVVGTSHFRCKSADEVRSIIEDVKPDGVVVELDPERVIRLTKEGAKCDEEQPFGADFLAAIDACRRMDVPLFVGDEYTAETKSRLIRTALKPLTYGPGRLMNSFLPRSWYEGDTSSDRRQPVDLIGTFVSDPMKLAPPAVSISPAFLLFLATIQDYRIDDLAANATTALALVLSFLATCKVFNTFIADRDDILTSSALRAASVIASLKKGDTVRKRWTFTVNNSNEELRNGQQAAAGTPLFTLKSPLEPGRIRNLNLFEPRWLRMIDGVRARPLESQSFGCVTCANKFYSAVDVRGREGRYADVIFERRGTMAALTQLIEGRRPVSGDRRVSARIEGRDTFVVDEASLTVSKDGYLVASDDICDGDNCFNSNRKDNEERKMDHTKIVVVVGLLHANGIIDRLGGE